MGDFRVRLRRKALDDVGQIRSWYRNIDPSVEERFLQALNEGLNRIETRPFAYRILYRKTRRILLGKFPYSVYYVIQDANVVVLAVIHHKRNPELARGISE
jgi:plasmid stabilization system protein ParE